MNTIDYTKSFHQLLEKLVDKNSYWLRERLLVLEMEAAAIREVLRQRS